MSVIKKTIAIVAAVLLADTCSYPLMAKGYDELIGVWAVESISPQGMLPQTVEFTRIKDGVSGVWNTWFNETSRKYHLTQVELHGDSLSFRWQDWVPQWQPLWKGKFSGGDRFSMTWIGEGKSGISGDDAGVPVRTRYFRRLSAREFAALRKSAPKNFITEKQPLPPLRDLPPNGLALTPPMGWNTWNPFKETVNEKAVREIADALVSSGLRDAGYVYVNLDDGWQGRRDERGILHANSKFQDMRALGKYLHAKGLKFGAYTSYALISATDYVGSYGYLEQDAKTFADWGIDYFKLDGGWGGGWADNLTESELRLVYQKMGEALRATGRPIVYSLCGVFSPQSGYRKVGGNLWRTGGDSVEGDRWKSVSARFEADGNPDENGPGGWNDADILLIGLAGLTPEENRTHMTLWVMLSSPLLLGNDVRHMTDEVKQILINKEVIAIDQDALGKQGRRAVKRDETEVWTKPLADGSHAVALFNRGEKQAEVVASWSHLGLSGSQQVRDLWRHTDLGERREDYSTTVPAHGAVLLRVHGVKEP